MSKKKSMMKKPVKHKKSDRKIRSMKRVDLG